MMLLLFILAVICGTLCLLGFLHPVVKNDATLCSIFVPVGGIGFAAALVTMAVIYVSAVDARNNLKAENTKLREEIALLKQDAAAWERHADFWKQRAQ